MRNTVSYNTQIYKDEKDYRIQFMTDSYETFKKIEAACRAEIDDTPKGCIAENECVKPCDGEDFSWAIKALKEGKAVRRKGWNGKNQFVQIAHSISYCRSGLRFNPEHKNIGNRAIVFVGTSGEQVGWLASQADMLADDWELAK